MSEDKVKQVIVVRKDLKMPVGKVAAQVAHAAMSFLTRGLMRPVRFEDDPWAIDAWMSHPYAGRKDPITVEERKLIVDEELAYWIDGSFTKVVVTVNSEDELLEIYEKAKNAGLRHTLITDEGRTVFDGVATHTCVAVGPNYIEAVNAITRHLPLYK